MHGDLAHPHTPSRSRTFTNIRTYAYTHTCARAQRHAIATNIHSHVHAYTHTYPHTRMHDVSVVGAGICVVALYLIHCITRCNTHCTHARVQDILVVGAGICVVALYLTHTASHPATHTAHIYTGKIYLSSGLVFVSSLFIWRGVWTGFDAAGLDWIRSVMLS